MCWSIRWYRRMKILVVNSSAYSARMVDIAKHYHIPCVDLKFSSRAARPEGCEEVLDKDKDIAVVATAHHETGTGVLNPVREIGKMAHDHGCVFVADDLDLRLLPIDIEKRTSTSACPPPRRACRHDRRLLDGREDQRDRQVKTTPPVLLLQPVHAVRLSSGSERCISPAGPDHLSLRGHPEYWAEGNGPLQRLTSAGGRS
jgi:hypothetical protein